MSINRFLMHTLQACISFSSKVCQSKAEQLATQALFYNDKIKVGYRNILHTHTKMDWEGCLWFFHPSHYDGTFLTVDEFNSKCACLLTVLHIMANVTCLMTVLHILADVTCLLTFLHVMAVYRLIKNISKA